jgi:hypothetical protein
MDRLVAQYGVCLSFRRILQLGKTFVLFDYEVESPADDQNRVPLIAVPFDKV